jgi:quercetin dioxygenase-like cupin family protein
MVRMQLAVIPWDGTGRPGESALRARLEGEGFSVFRWHDGPGAEYAPHAHDHDESIIVVDGEITFGVGDRALCLGPGDRLMLPAGTVHTASTGAAGATYLIGERTG